MIERRGWARWRNLMNGASFQRPGGGGFGLSGPSPRDIIILLSVVLGTFSLQFFASTAPLHNLLLLSSSVWRAGWVWQVVTYPFAGVGAPSIWFLLELLILFMFSRTVYGQLGRRGFWRWLITISLLCSLQAVIVDLVMNAVGSPAPTAFSLMQGQHMLLTLMIAAFATMNREATILLFFVLPVQAKWFLLLELLFAFMGFLGSKDLPGFIGLCMAVGLTFVYLTTGFGIQIRRTWLRVQERWIAWRLGSMRRKSGLRIVKGQDEGADDEDRFVN
jgi:hypothetical protein